MAAAAPVLSIVIPTHRWRHLLEECVESVRVAVAEVPEPTEVVVVVDGAGPETAAWVGERFPEVVVLDLPENVGFASAVARGIAHARGDWIVLLNDDVTVEPQALGALLAAVRSASDVGAAAAQMRFAGRRDTINSAGIEVDGLGIASDRLLGRPIDDSEDAPTEVFGACAGAAVYSRAMLEETGGFDTSFYVYLEDVDLAWRARMHGWRTLYVPGAVVYHHHSATMEHASPRKYFLVGRNRVRLLAKNATASHLLRASVPMLLYDAAYVVAVGARSRTLAPLRGRLAGLREWRRYRRAGRNDRRPVQLASRRAFRDAFERDRAWRRRNRPR